MKEVEHVVTQNLISDTKSFHVKNTILLTIVGRGCSAGTIITFP